MYSAAQILLLDDILAALDVHTYAVMCQNMFSAYCLIRSKHIVRECLQGDLLRGRTVVLVVRVLILWVVLQDVDNRLDTQCRAHKSDCYQDHCGWPGWCCKRGIQHI